jgi:hypothetical protein
MATLPCPEISIYGFDVPMNIFKEKTENRRINTINITINKWNILLFGLDILLSTH